MNYIKHKGGVNLADARAGASVISVSDEFFAPCIRMLSPKPPVFIEGKYDDNGKWMDGWESRRKRTAGFDHCVIRLAAPGKIKAVDIDTSNFIGNFPPHASFEACNCDGEPNSDTIWSMLLDKVDLKKDAHHLHTITNSETFSHVRLSIFPDGGVARLRVMGEPRPSLVSASHKSSSHKGSVDECFGSSMSALNYPDRGINMGDGWETARRRVPGNDWVIFQLAAPSLIENVEFDTAHYKGNYPDSVMLQGGFLADGSIDEAVNQSLFWKQILSNQKLKADAICAFEIQQADRFPLTHVKVNIIPDGGLSRVRLNGHFCD